MKHAWLWFGMLVVIVAGCVPGAAVERLPTQALVPSTPTPRATPTPSPVRVTPPPGPAEVIAVEQASPVPAQAQVIGVVLADLADRLAVDAREIDVDGVEAMTWETLACDAEPASITAQARVEGFHVVLAFQEQRYSYRASNESDFVFCEDEGPGAAGEPVILDTNLSALVELASQDLAQRLDLPLRRVFLVEAYPVMWTDASFGCALSTEEIPLTPIAGYRIVLRVGGETYDYHANYRQAIFCPTDAVRLPFVEATPEGAAAAE